MYLQMRKTKNIYDGNAILMFIHVYNDVLGGLEICLFEGILLVTSMDCSSVLKRAIKCDPWTLCNMSMLNGSVVILSCHSEQKSKTEHLKAWGRWALSTELLILKNRTHRLFRHSYSKQLTFYITELWELRALLNGPESAPWRTWDLNSQPSEQ